MSPYKFSFRRLGRFSLWRSFRVVGHRSSADDVPLGHSSSDKMILYFADGGVREIANWSRCELRLGTDWVLAVKRQAEKQSGTSVSLDVNAH